MENLAGQVLDGRYRLEKLLGEGGMGQVYQGRHDITGRKVAIKLLLPEYANNAEVVERFYREAKAATAVGNEHICEVLDMRPPQLGTPYLVMEHLSGETLKDRIRDRGPLQPNEAVAVFRQILEGLAAAHDQGIIHRDMKPENVFLVSKSDGPPAVKLLDFGISKFSDGSGDNALTLAGTILGSPYYMSPEQANGDAIVGPLSDLYSVGVMLHEALTGAVPFDAPTFSALVIKIATQEPPHPSDEIPSIPRALGDVALKAMNRQPAQRFSSARDMAATLANLQLPPDQPRREIPQTLIPQSRKKAPPAPVPEPFAQVKPAIPEAEFPPARPPGTREIDLPTADDYDDDVEDEYDNAEPTQVVMAPFEFEDSPSPSQPTLEEPIFDSDDRVRPGEEGRPTDPMARGKRAATPAISTPAPSTPAPRGVPAPPPSTPAPQGVPSQSAGNISPAEASGASFPTAQAPADASGASFQAVQAPADASGASFQAVQAPADASGASFQAVQAPGDASGASFQAVGVGEAAAGPGETRRRKLMLLLGAGIVLFLLFAISGLAAVFIVLPQINRETPDAPPPVAADTNITEPPDPLAPRPDGSPVIPANVVPDPPPLVPDASVETPGSDGGVETTAATAEAPAASDAAPSAEIIEAGPSTVAITITADPRHARIFHNGRELDGNPATVTVPADGAVHEVSARARGYHESETRFTASEDARDVEIQLRRRRPRRHRDRDDDGPTKAPPLIDPWD